MSYVADAVALEQELRERLRGRRVVLEIGLDADLHEQVTAVLEPIVQWRTADDVLREFPALLATYLVGHAVYHYQGGIWNSIDLRAIDRSWGERFTIALKKLDLENFDDLVLQESAQKYVARIVAHGGLPRYCVGDLFELIFHDLPYSAGAREMLARWRERSSTFANIDRPVKRFFLYGGPIAVDFLDRCIDLIRHEALTGALPSPEEIGLPPYLLTAYRALDRRLERARSSDRRSNRAFPRPVVALDPWSATGPELTLPSTGNREPGRWNLLGEGMQRYETSRFDKRRVALVPSARWRVELESGADRREWIFDATALGPVLAFEPGPGRLLDLAAGLRLDDVWLLAFRDAQVDGLDAQGQPHELRDLEELPEPVGEWSAWSARHVDLSGLTKLRLRHGGDEHRVSVRATSARPTLEPEALAGVTAAGATAVYCAMPDVVLPAGSDLALWSLRVIADNAEPVTAPATDLVDHEGHVSLAELVPPDTSRLQLTIRGALGDTVRHEFAVVPGLDAERPRRLVWPGTLAEVRWSATSGRFGDAPIGAAVTTPIDDARDVAQVEWHGPRGSIALSAAVPKLLWGALTESGTVLGIEPVRLVADDLGGAARGLAISTGMAVDGAFLELRTGDTVLQRNAERSISTTGRWVFPLAEFADALRVSREATFVLALRIGARSIDVASIRATLDIRDLVAHTRVAGDFTSVELEFDEPRAVNHRVARLWPLTRPWQPVISEPIADDASGRASISRYDELPPGRYLAEIAIDDGWTAAPLRPVFGPATTPITIGTADDMHEHLKRLPLSSAFNVLEIAALSGVIPRHLARDEFDGVASAALCALRGLQRQPSSQPRQVGAVGSLLLANIPVFVDKLIDAAASPAWTSDEVLRVQIGLVNRLEFCGRDPQIEGHTWQALWSAAPLVAAALEFDHHAAGDGCDRIEVACAWDPRMKPTDIARGEPVDQLFLSLPLEQLEQIIVVAQLPVDLPSPWLHIDAWARANFQWLRAHKRGDFNAAESWLTAQSLLQAQLPDIPYANEYCAARLAPKGTFAWAGFPAATAAACHVVTDSRLQPDAERFLVGLLPHASLLVTRDLLLALALSRYAPSS
jgi:hypothetical protein